MNPFFSVLVPSYNRPEYIKELLDSILKEEFNDFEIIISDDCSPKQKLIQNIIQSYSSDNRIKVFFQENNLGEVNNKNFLISKAKGNFNILIGDDDFFVPNALKTLFDYINRNPSIEIFTFGYNVVDENSCHISSYFSPCEISFNNDNINFSKAILCADMMPLWIFHPSTFCCKNGIEKDLGYKSNVGMAEDLFFIFESLLLRKNFHVIPETIFNWRKIINTSKSDQLNQSSEYLADLLARIKIYNQISKNYINDFKNLFISRNYIRRFLIKSVLADNRIVPKDIYTNIQNEDLYLPHIIKDELKIISRKSSLTVRFYKLLLLPQRIYHFYLIFGLKNTLLQIKNILSIQKFKYMSKYN